VGNKVGEKVGSSVGSAVGSSVGNVLGCKVEQAGEMHGQNLCVGGASIESSHVDVEFLTVAG